MSKLEESFAEELRLFGMPTAKRQFRFHPTRKWKFDFAWPDKKVAVEIHGGLFLKSIGGHNRGASMEDDFEKINEATALGWRVYVFGPKWCYRKANRASNALEFMYGVLKPVTAKAV